MRVEELVHRCEDYPAPFKEYSPSKHHLAGCYECDKYLAYRKVEKQHKEQREEKIKRQKIGMNSRRECEYPSECKHTGIIAPCLSPGNRAYLKLSEDIGGDTSHDNAIGIDKYMAGICPV